MLEKKKVQSGFGNLSIPLFLVPRVVFRRLGRQYGRIGYGRQHAGIHQVAQLLSGEEHDVDAGKCFQREGFVADGDITLARCPPLAALGRHACQDGDVTQGPDFDGGPRKRRDRVGRTIPVVSASGQQRYADHQEPAAANFPRPLHGGGVGGGRVGGGGGGGKKKKRGGAPCPRLSEL